MNEQTATLRYRMSDRDVFYGGGVVNGARSITLMEDTAKRLMAKVYGNSSRVVEVKKVRLYVPCFAGDYMEYIARIKKEEKERVLIEVRSYKIIDVPENPPYPSSIDVLEDPPLSTVVQFWFERPAKEKEEKGVGDGKMQEEKRPARKRKPLEGLKVVDLTSALNGPFCTMILADYGAEVLKIEPVGGEQCRTWGPLDEKSGESGFYNYVNRNKKGATLNLKSEKGLQMFYDLVKDADILVENYKGGVTKKLKIDYETIRKINPGIIYASGSGFGQNSPISYRPCYDIVAQAMGGMINLTGFKDTDPVKVGPSVADHVAGIYLAVGTLLALYHKEKTGEGQLVDVSMFDTIFSLLENAIVNYTVGGFIPERNGNVDPSIAPFDVYKCKDGFTALGVGNDRLFEKFCRTIGHEELLDDPRYETNDLRCQNYIPDLQNLIRDWCKDYTKKELEDIMDKAGIPCGPVLNVKEAIEHPHIQAREMMVHVNHPTAGDQYFQGCVMKLSETPGTVETPSPLLGQHNCEIFGITKEEEAKLKEEGVL
ncbi:Formyl-coenzyme A transferase [Eubacteriaceae bacterium CHKCI004]|nr:Formyl-coenzyme A transferase [Eubacteriaceae bacterium CHKCI004]